MTVKTRPPKTTAPAAPSAKAPVAKAVAGRTRADSGMRYSIVLMTPEEAQGHLANSDSSDFGTSLFKKKVERFTASMAALRWELNGDTVVISKSGKVLDGRARLKACVESGKAFPVIRVTNIDEAAYYSIDAHSRRSTTDMLVIDDVEHARVVSSAWQAVAGYLNASPRDRFRYQGSTAVTTDEILVLNQSYKQAIQHSADFIVGLKISKFLPNTVATACHYLASLVDLTMADSFFREMADAEPRARSTPAVLRRRYEDPSSNTTFTYRMALFSKAWRNYSQQSKPISKAELDFKGPVERLGNLGSEAFPVIHGLENEPPLDFEALRAQQIEDSGRTVQPYDLSSYSGVTVLEMDITPDIADGFLGANGVKKGNRPVRKGHVKDLARMMETRQWHNNGKTIKLTATGDLIDGQHRCSAIVSLAGKVASFRSLVVSGLPADTFGTMDLGERKSLAKRLRAGGETSATHINAVCTQLWRINANVAGGEPHMVEAQAIYAADQEAIDRSVAFVRSIRISKTLDISIAGALHLLFHRKSPKLADEFMEQLAKGTNMAEKSPVYMLREELNDDAKRDKKLFNAPRRARAVIKAWNRFVLKNNNKGLKLIEPTDTGYPVIMGAL